MRVLVIGAASGLGKALVAKAKSRGDDVSAVDADQTALKRLDDAVTKLVCDIADAEAIETTLERLGGHGAFDLVVISAGINATGRFEEIDPAAMNRVVSVNLTGTIMLTAALVRRDLIALRGRLVFVSSLSHFVAYPGASAYAASKDGIVVFAKSIRRALRRERAITVQVFAPGPMDTPHAVRHAPRNGRKGRRADPDQIAGLILRSTRGGVFVPGIGASLAALAGRLAPATMGRLMRRLIYERL